MLAFVFIWLRFLCIHLVSQLSKSSQQQQIGNASHSIIAEGNSLFGHDEHADADGMSSAFQSTYAESVRDSSTQLASIGTSTSDADATNETASTREQLTANATTQQHKVTAFMTNNGPCTDAYNIEHRVHEYKVKHGSVVKAA